jgi:hypothetical protein
MKIKKVNFIFLWTIMIFILVGCSNSTDKIQSEGNSLECWSCGTSVSINTKTCPNCYKFLDSKEVSTEKNSIVESSIIEKIEENTEEIATEVEIVESSEVEIIESTEVVKPEKPKKEDNYIKEREALEVNLPKDFIKATKNGITRYWRDGSDSFIIYQQSNNDGSLDYFSEETIQEYIKMYANPDTEKYKSVELLEFGPKNVDGHYAFSYTSKYTLTEKEGGGELIRIDYIIENGDKYDTIIFTDCYDGCTDALNDCMNNMKYTNYVGKETLVIEISNEFVKTEENDKIYYRNSTNHSNIIISKMENNGYLENVTEEFIRDIIVSEFKAMYGDAIDVELIDSEFLTVDGHKAFKSSISTDIEGFNMSQTQFVIENGDEYDIVVFSDSNYTFKDEFEKCIEKLRYE